MRHGVSGKKLSRTREHRLALRRNMAQSLFEHGRLRTTLPKARVVRVFAEKLITLALDGSLAARQRAIAMMNDRSVIPAEYRQDYDALSDAKRALTLRSRSGRRYRASTTRPGVKFTAESIVHRLFTTVASQIRERNEKRGCSGGYTRIIKLADRRLGDAAPLAILELVSAEDAPRKPMSDKTPRKRRARLRYDFYAGKDGRRRRRRGAEKSPAAAAEDKAAD
ncbi:MAG: 50S ribosomal protein L17 [Phycisphaerales bacterium]|nr:50S ribosomal protein L17 [Phycisphaerales bacterium]